MNNHPRASEFEPVADRLAEELDGLVDLGSREEIARLTRQILAHPRPTPTALLQAVRAIGTMPMQSRHQWRTRVETAYARLNTKDQRIATGTMLAFHYSADDFEAALRFCRISDLNAPMELNLAMEVYLHFNRLADAKDVARKCADIAKCAETASDIGCIADAIASYRARTGQWDDALKAWAAAPSHPLLACHAAVKRAEVSVARTFDALNKELRMVDILRKNPSLQLSLLGMESAMIDQTEEHLLWLKQGLEEIFPTDRQIAYGLGPSRSAAKDQKHPKFDKKRQNPE